MSCQGVSFCCSLLCFVGVCPRFVERSPSVVLGPFCFTYELKLASLRTKAGTSMGVARELNQEPEFEQPPSNNQQNIVPGQSGKSSKAHQQAARQSEQQAATKMEQHRLKCAHTRTHKHPTQPRNKEAALQKRKKQKAQATSPTACSALFSAPPRSPRRTSWNPRGTLVEPWWNPRGTLPRTTPEPIWAETKQTNKTRQTPTYQTSLPTYLPTQFTYLPTQTSPAQLKP